MAIEEKIEMFRTERDWKQFHNEKDLAISINLEASELLECFQWKSVDEALAENRSKIVEELADVFIYCHMLANNMNLDIDEIITKKLESNNEKYPVSKAKGKKLKYTEYE